MRIIRSKGTSYTRFEAMKRTGPRTAGRGLLLDSQATGSLGIVQSNQLSDFIDSDDLDLILRQYVQALDKVIRKPRSFSRLDLATYLARNRLGDALWAAFVREHCSDDAIAPKIIDRLQGVWRAKVHPYVRRDTVSWEAPHDDQNSKDLAKREAEARESKVKNDRPYGYTRWSEVFGDPFPEHAELEALRAAMSPKARKGNQAAKAPSAPPYSADASRYARIAELIVEHLRIQEMTTAKKKRMRGKKETGYGLIQTRGESIARNSFDPNDTERTKKATERWAWDEAAEATYFRFDVAAEIRRVVHANPAAPGIQRIFGELLYAHLCALGGPDKTKHAPLPRAVWNLHNQVRAYYARLAESTRFRRALSEAQSQSAVKLDGLLPQDSKDLLARLGAKEQNSKVSGLIRRGKIAAHAIDLCAPDLLRKKSAAAPDALIGSAMDYYVTSIGQADIKRNEAFVRVLRNAVAFSTRTLRTWMDPEGEFGVAASTDSAEDDLNVDLADKKVACLAASGVAQKALLENAALVYGLRSYGPRAGSAGQGNNRTSLLFRGDDLDREVAFALLRLSARIRNSTYHFKTRARLVDVVKSGLLKPVPATSIEPLETRDNGAEVEEVALGRLHSLLDFDLSLEAQVLADQLNALRFGAHVPPGQRRNALALLARIPGSDDIVTPKFMSLLRRASDLLSHAEGSVPEPIKPFKALDLGNLSKTTTGANYSRIGLLRLVYDRAFPNWLEDNEENSQLLASILDEVRACKTRRRRAYEDERKAVPSGDEPFTDALLEGITSLTELNLRFAAATLTSTGRAPKRSDDSPLPDKQHHDPYRPDKLAQQEHAEQVEQLRREVYLALFASFLNASKLGFIWAIDDTSEDAAPVTVEEVPTQAGTWTDWQRQFYAWLYLVPPDQISLLRHQFRKSRILETKAHRDRQALITPRFLGPRDDDPEMVAARQSVIELANASAADEETLIALDRLMGLYTRVQGAGFSGTEHVASLKQGELLYEDPTDFADIFSEAAETHHLSVPGTRRGLRQIVRFGTARALTPIFKHHKVQKDEVETFRAEILGGGSKIFQERRDLHELIVKSARDRDADRIRLLVDCKHYSELAAKTSNYDFAISAARLTEFANLHHLLMEVIGRLADFTLTWERDGTCLMLGAILEQFPAGIFVVDDKKIALKIGDGAEAVHRLYALDKSFSPPGKLLDQLEGERSDLIARYFRHKGRPDENPKDLIVRQARKEAARVSGKPVPPYKEGKGHKSPPGQIRNDLAHFNVLDGKRDKNSAPKLNLTYLVNAVRSLMSYDRKLKNAVPKAVADILLEHGFVMRWRLDRDRLTRPKVTPAYLVHLGFLREVEGTDPRFVLPRTSRRAVSMTKALFDFSGRGEVPQDGGIKDLKYPDHPVPKPLARRD